MNKLIISNSFLYLALGLLSIALANRTQELTRGLELYGVTMGVVILSQALGSYLFGRISNNNKRIESIMLSLVIILALSICLWIVGTYILMIVILIIFGMINGVIEVNIKAYIADATNKKNRINKIGNYEAITTLSAGGSMILTGLISNSFLFPIIIFLILISIIILIKRRRK